MTHVELLVDRYKSKGLLIDSNLLLLYFIGSFDIQLVGDPKFKKLAKYDAGDFQRLIRLRSVFKRLVTTAHVLTEVSNLTGDLPEATKVSCFGEFSKIFVETEELPVLSALATRRRDFRYLGLTDSVLAQLSRDFLVVSDDARLVAKLQESQLEALNFSNLFDLNQFSYKQSLY